MIRSLTGTLVAVEDQTAVLRPLDAPFEVEVLVPAYWVPRLCTHAGERLTVFCRLHLESQNQGASFVPRLLGFPSASDRAFFEVFTSVKGLGQRRAMRAMASPPGEIAGWIASRNTKGLPTLPEIGKRLAETVIAGLRYLVKKQDVEGLFVADETEFSVNHIIAARAMIEAADTPFTSAWPCSR